MGFSSITPRFGSRVRSVAPLDKPKLLARGEWIDASQARHFSISDDERITAWLTGKPLERAADWRVDHTDSMDAQLVYRRYALAVHAQGWSGFPEDRENRRPKGMSDSRGYYKTEPSKRRDALLPAHRILEESDNAGLFHTNLALVMGPASLHTRALDLDILDPVLAEQIYALAIEHLGPTPFIRVGRAPKMLLVYRVEGDDISLPTKSYAFLGDDGSVEKVGEGDQAKVKNAIEFLSTGHNFTCYGLHHGTSRTFDWSRGELHPAIAGPEHAPVITKKQLNAFFTAANRVRSLSNYSDGKGFSSPTGGDSEVSKFEAMGGVWIPQHSRGSWLKDDEGYVVQGREAFMSSMCWAMMSANIDLLRSHEGSQHLLSSFQLAVVSAIASGGKWSHEKARKECIAKFHSTRKKFDDSLAQHDRTGKWLAPAIPWRLMADGTRPFAQHAPTSPRPTDGSMDWLPEQPSVFAELSGTQKIKGLIRVPQTREQIETNKAERALVAELADREAIHARVAEGVRTAGLVFLDVVNAERQANELAPMHVLMAPTGAGKTTIIIDALAEFAGEYPRQPGDGPILFMLPSHANISEALQTAERTGMIVPNPADFDERKVVAALNRIGVKAALLSGKRNHCLRLDDLAALSAAGIGTSGLCKATIEEDGDKYAASKKRQLNEKVETTEILCPFRERGECGYWTQMAEVEQADVVFLAHSYLTMHQVPEAVKKARAVFVDESVVYRLLHFTEMRLDVLEKPRGAPWVTKAEQKEQPNRSAKDLGEDMMQRREHIAGVVTKAFAEGECPAQAVIDEGITPMIRDAIKTVVRSHSAERDVNPRMTSDEITRFATRPVGLALIEEERFWRILEDRVENIRRLDARGDTDARLHLFYKSETVIENKKPKKVQVPYVRISWRSEMNWGDAPMMMLDASASPEIMAKCSGREITVHNVDAPLHVRTVAMIERPWSNRAFIPGDNAEQAEIEVARATIRKARALITKTAVSYAHGRVLVGATIAVRQVLSQGGWTPPPNVDWGHFGAFRGQDAFKHHVAAISIGRSEQPIGVIDAYAAALTYDDDVPEKPYDQLGTGLDASGALLFRKGAPRVIPMRSGHDIGRLVPQMPGRWAKLLESQWREEELRQFLGRLRPVYRGAAPVQGVSNQVPVWICMSSTLPEHITVDEIFTLDDMTKGSEFYDLMRLSGGIMAEGLTARLPNCRPILDGEPINAWTDRVLSDNVDLRTRLIAAMHLVCARIDGVERTIRVAAWHEDPEAEVLEAVARVNAGRFGKIEVEIISSVPSGLARVTASAPRKPDRIDGLLADMAPFGDTNLLLELRESRLRAAHERIVAAGRSMDLEEIEQTWRGGTDLDDLVEREVAEFERSRWVRVYDGEEVYEIEPHYLQAA